MNKIVIELSAEDRARLDRLSAALEKAATIEIEVNPVALDTTPQEAPKEEPKENNKPEEENTPEAVTEDTTPAEEEEDEPKIDITLEHIQQKVVQLAAGNGGAKKAQVRAIINAYGSKVSDLKDQPDKWAEVWEKLTALESEA